MRGPVSFEGTRNPVQNIYIKKVEKKKMFGYDKAELWNTVIKTYPNVSQYWTYGKAKFLAPAGLQPRLSALQILRINAGNQPHTPSKTPAARPGFLRWASAHGFRRQARKDSVMRAATIRAKNRRRPTGRTS